MIGITTHYEYAVLSAKCYADSEPLELPPHWEVVVTSDEIMDTDGLSFSRDGFHAIVFMSHVNEVSFFLCACAWRVCVCLCVTNCYYVDVIMDTDRLNFSRGEFHAIVFMNHVNEASFSVYRFFS